MAAARSIISLLLLVTVAIFFLGTNVESTDFTLQNRCSYTVWPGTLSGDGSAAPGDGGFELAPGALIQLPGTHGWSGRFWPRTGCTFDSSGAGKCTTGNCSGGLRCTGGGAPPATLVEFALNGANGKDFYDVSLVDGYNVGMGVQPTVSAATGDCQYAGCVNDLNRSCPSELQVATCHSACAVQQTGSTATGDCQYAGCVNDLNKSCPSELQVTGPDGQVAACRSACAAFGTPEYCCTGDHSTPNTCLPTQYSQLFKNACPTAYSYVYDDASGTCTSTGSDYLITFCPTE